MKILYVSDLDGTLLNSKQHTSSYTNQVINQLVDEGMLFSYATARSYYSAKPATKGLTAKIPIMGLLLLIIKAKKFLFLISS